MSPKTVERLEKRVQDLDDRLREIHLILSVSKNPEYVRMAQASLDPEAGVAAEELLEKLRGRTS